MNSIQPIATTNAPEAIGPYSQGIRAGKLVFLSGQLPIDPSSGELISGSIEVQTRRILENIKAVAAQAGADLSSVVKTTVFLKDMSDFSKMNDIYAEYFTTTLPARSAAQVSELPKGADIEIETVLYLNE